jgi:TatD family-associated radical SAM protein
MDNDVSHSLWLDHEPSIDEVIDAFKNTDVTPYDEIVFCGFGEPIEALSVLLPAARFIKHEYAKPIRINTNGLGNLIHGRDITPEFEGLIDTISISLNTPNAERYHELVRSKFGDISFDAMLDFAKKCTQYVPNVVLSTVDTTLTKEEEEECRRICEKLHVTYRIRAWED